MAEEPGGVGERDSESRDLKGAWEGIWLLVLALGRENNRYLCQAGKEGATRRRYCIFCF